MSKRTFYDQWYRIGDLRVGLRASVLVRRHVFRKEPWYVYYDPALNGYFRARPQTHEVIKHIRPDRTLREIWRDYVRTEPTRAPGQEDFFELIATLYQGNLLFVEGAVSEGRILERALRKKKKPFAQKISQLLFFRVPLWDPEPFLERHKRLIDVIYHPLVVAFVAAVCLFALYQFVLNAERAFAQASNILQANNLVALFLATFITHIFHEMSHAALCKHFGGHVRTMGVMFLMFTPLPYADVTSSWAFRDTNKRAMVAAAGMYVDLFSCALATLFWAYSPPGLANGIALNLMFVTAFYTFVFNANPLMRFDGHYILSDLVAIPNLHKVAKSQFDVVARKVILNEPIPLSERVSPRRRLFLVGFYAASFVYRNLVMIGIVLFVADQYYGLGLVGAFAIAYSSFILPLAKTLKPLTNRQFMAKHRRRIYWILAGVGLVFAGLVFVPVPDARRLEGVVEAMTRTNLYAPAPGSIVTLPRHSGQRLKEGEVVLQLENPELLDERAEIRASMASNEVRKTQASSNGGAELASIEQGQIALRKKLAENERQIASLMVQAAHEGVWVLGERPLRAGNWVERGEPVGQIVDETRLKFLGILPQESSYGIGTLTKEKVSARIEGARDQEIAVSALSIVPYSSKELPSAALTPLGGGGTSIATDNPDELHSVERFFLFTATLDMQGQVGLDGRTGWLRIELPPRPIAAQLWETARQFFQKRYKL